jgi:hypothetical protein
MATPPSADGLAMVTRVPRSAPLSRRLSTKMSSRISSVPLYLHPERVEEELAAIGLGSEAELTVDQVAPFDSDALLRKHISCWGGRAAWAGAW